MYMRNRYYNPQAGTFTQVDPIGIAGGLNVYGFAEGDPVTYSDPYGLCPPKHVCPTREQLSGDRYLRGLAEVLYQASGKLGDAEFGAYITYHDRQFGWKWARMGEVGEVYMGDPPPDAVAEIHTHHDQTTPSGFVLPGSTPSGADVRRVRSTKLDELVVTRNKLYILYADEPSTVYTYDRPKPRNVELPRNDN